jgi:electron transfer flavoprotein beta subunit
MPVLLTVDSAVNQPRRLSLLGILAARKRKITVFNFNDLDLDANQIGLDGSPTQTQDYFTVESSKQVEMLTGNPQQIVADLINKLGLG